ncbi:MAG: hypothetical protein EOO29_52135 [Comamonadaceae bacterium]|nr:MAG: hypothetical protein EOO29_52135 [Comamonadaceae bacterium]
MAATRPRTLSTPSVPAKAPARAKGSAATPAPAAAQPDAKPAETPAAVPAPVAKAAKVAQAGTGRTEKVVAKADKTAKAAKADRTDKEKADKAEKADKERKPKLVRDSFTIPKPEYAVLDALKQRAAALGRPVKKSELLRAGIKALAAMPDAGFLASIAAVPAVKTGRPAKT